MRRSHTTFTVGQLSIAGEWEDRFPLQYTAASLQNSKRPRRRKRQRIGPGAADDSHERLLRELANDRAASRSAAVKLRRERGVCWRGGGVGGNPLYRRQPFTSEGLLSDEAAILKLFVTKTPRRRRLLTGDTKDRVESTDSKLLALDSAYVVANTQMRGVLRVEIDQRLSSWAAVPEMCRTAGLPPPNIAVGYVDAHGEVLHPHLLWIIEHSVAFKGKGHAKPKRFFRGVLRGLTEALVPYGADIGGLSNAMRVKNPLCPWWDREILAREPYQLTDLYRTPKASTIRSGHFSQREQIPDHPNAAVAAQSNKVFRQLAPWAYQRVSRYRDAGQWQDFSDAVEAEACRLCCGANGDSRAVEHAAQRLARSVSTWTWKHYRPKLPPLSLAEIRECQAEAGENTAARRRSATEAEIRAAASALAERGILPSCSALQKETRKSESTIRRYLRDLPDLRRIAAQPADTGTPVIRSHPLDRKDNTTTATKASSLPIATASRSSSAVRLIPQNNEIVASNPASLADPSPPPAPDAPAVAPPQVIFGTETNFRARTPRPTMPPCHSPANASPPSQPPQSSPAPLAQRGSVSALSVDGDTDSQPILFSLIPTPLCRLSDLSLELAHATSLPALQTGPLLGQNLLIENTARDPVGLCFERYRSLLKAFIISTDLAYEKDFTEQSGTEVWQKLYPGTPVSGRRRPRQRCPHHLTDLTRRYHQLEQTELLVLCLQPRNERHFKTAQQAFVRERIDYASVFNGLLEARLCHGRPTWVFTPHRLDDPEFVAVYGESFARLIATNLTPLHFGQPASDRAAPRRNLAPSEVRWHDQPPAAIFVDPSTGATAIPDQTRLPPPLPSRAPPPPQRPAVLSRLESGPSPTQSAEPVSPYVAEMARYLTPARFAARRSKSQAAGEVPPGIPARPSQPAPSSQNRRTRLIYGDQ